MQDTWINLSHFNTRSLCSKFDLFADFISDGTYDVGLSETWLDPSLTNNVVNMPGYALVRKDRIGRGGGVAFFVKESFTFTVLGDMFPDGPLENMWISIKVAGRKVCFGTLYRPPSANLNICIENLESMLVALLPEYDYVLFGGDLNVDLLVNNNYGSTLLFRLLNKYGLKQIVNEPTKVTAITETLLDIIVTSCPEIVGNVDVYRMDDISDHRFVKCDIKLIRLKPTIRFKSYRDFSKFNYDTFLLDLHSIFWDYIYTFEDINDMVSLFNDRVLYLFDIHAPFKTSRLTKPPAP